jgi:hypothetical protein
VQLFMSKKIGKQEPKSPLEKFSESIAEKLDALDAVDSQYIKQIPFEVLQEQHQESEYLDDKLSYVPRSTYDDEMMIFELSPHESELLLLKYMGFNSGEIVKMMKLKDPFWYYRLNNRLQRHASRIMAR